MPTRGLRAAARSARALVAITTISSMWCAILAAGHRLLPLSWAYRARGALTCVSSTDQRGISILGDTDIEITLGVHARTIAAHLERSVVSSSEQPAHLSCG
jgi:hypothetical protein